MSNTSTKPPLKVPHYEQEQNNSCLAACVRMLLTFQGIEKSELEIRKLLKTRHAGTNPLNVAHLKDWSLNAIVSFSNLNEFLEAWSYSQQMLILVEKPRA